MIYARPRNDIAYNEQGGKLCQAVLYAENEPDNLPVNGSNIVGMSENDTFAAGACLICLDTKNIYMVGSDGGAFILWKEGD